MNNNKQRYNFDWTNFTEKELRICNREIGSYEDNIYGFLYLSINDKYYLVDIHYEDYGSKDKGFDLEVYESDENWLHKFWLSSIKDIKSATNYKRFCRRAENLIIDFLLHKNRQMQMRKVKNTMEKKLAVM